MAVFFQVGAEIMGAGKFQPARTTPGSRLEGLVGSKPPFHAPHEWLTAADRPCGWLTPNFVAVRADGVPPRASALPVAIMQRLAG